MAFSVTPAQRRMAMVAMLVLAVAGAVIRTVADNPSTLRDVGTLLLVLWLPTVGNLVGWVLRKLPQRAHPPAPDFGAHPFAPHRKALLTPAALAPAFLSGLDQQSRRCAVMLGNQGFTARMANPVAAWLESGQAQALELEFLRPDVALPLLPAGTAFHLVLGNTAVASGHVLA